jgi:hypothetical protein
LASLNLARKMEKQAELPQDFLENLQENKPERVVKS